MAIILTELHNMTVFSIASVNFLTTVTAVVPFIGYLEQVLQEHGEMHRDCCLIGNYMYVHTV